MEYSEIPGVEDGIGRKFKFCEIKWMTKTKFESTMKEARSEKDLAIHPRLNDHSDINKLEFIGKTIPKSPPVLIVGGINTNNNLNATNSSPYQYLEIAGTIFKANQRGNVWKLRITHESHVYEIEEDFLVLSIENQDSFYWCSNKDESAKNQYSFTVNYKVKKECVKLYTYT